MGKSKNATLSKAKIKAVQETDEHEAVHETAAAEINPKKLKTPIEIEEADPAILLDDKPEAETVLGEEAEESESDEAGLDEEVIDPFGDKWEQ